MAQARGWVARFLLVGFMVVAGLGPAAPASAAQWVQNFVPTELWSGPDPAAISFGTAPQWDYFEVISPQGNGRLYVRVVRTQNFAFIDTASVGPAGSPPVGWPNVTAPVAAQPVAPPTPSVVPIASAGPRVTAPPSGATQAVIGPVPGFPIMAQPGLWPALQRLQTISHTWTLQALASTGTRLDWGRLPADAAAMYEPERAQITINERWSKSDARALAAVIEHESKHVADILAGMDVNSPDGCITTEVNAFREEAKTWGELVGVKGKKDPENDLERSLNYKLDQLQTNPASIPTLILQNPGYRMQCRL